LERANVSTITNLPTAEIEADPALQPRVGGTDPEHVRELEESSAYWPPLSVVRRADRYLLVDGFHRLAAAKNLNLVSVPVTVLEPPDSDDLLALAFSLNAAHGRPLTLSDRRAYSSRLLQAHPERSDQEIGRRAGLAQATVAKLRGELERGQAIPPVEARIGGDGRAYAVKRKEKPRTITAAAALASALSTIDRNSQRKLVRYLAQLADFLEEQGRFTDFETFEDAAHACRSVLGADAARELGERLGLFAGNIFQIALALGYCPEDEA
jgi:ParB-like chromosome segregation protein Spo0J